MMATTFKVSGKPNNPWTYCSALVAASWLRLRTWIQQLPSPTDSAATCARMPAIDASSTQTSVLVLSPAITMPSAASFRKAEPCGLHLDRCSSTDRSSTRTNSHDLPFREVGERSSASIRRSSFCFSSATPVYLRMLRRRRKRSCITVFDILLTSIDASDIPRARRGKSSQHDRVLLEIQHPVRKTAASATDGGQPEGTLARAT